MKNWGESELRRVLLEGIPLIDVRAPVEFAAGHLPGAINLPLLDDRERALIGTTYKIEGSAAAVALGHHLISGDVKESRLEAWRTELRRHPEAGLYCFRGGLRSQITQAWLKEAGFARPLVEGGFKAARRLLRASLDENFRTEELIVVSGETGAGKTALLMDWRGKYFVYDLEGLARHRGSAFGAEERAQPSQVDFENELAVTSWRRPRGGFALIEDESRMIGRRTIPTEVFAALRRSPIVWLDEPLEKRVDGVFRDYIAVHDWNRGPDFASAVFQGFATAIGQIERKLGGMRAAELRSDIEHSRLRQARDGDLHDNRVWIRKLLEWYYDPLYRRGREKRNPPILARGARAEIDGFLMEHLSKAP